MSGSELYVLACGQKWPALIGELGKLDAAAVSKQIRFVISCKVKNFEMLFVSTVVVFNT